jgi:DTW domain-containing protein YfiP
LFFPSADSMELTSSFARSFSKPLNLIVPDGNWRQASKIHYRYRELADIPRVMIKGPNTDTQRLRAETTLEGMATLQAIAWALGAIEGEQIRDQLLELYALKLARTLEGRGTAGK